MDEPRDQQDQVEQGRSHEGKQLAELRRRLDEEYVSVGEMAVWLIGVVLVMTGLHFFTFWAKDWFKAGGGTDDAPPVVIQKEQTLLWYGQYGPGGYALVRVPSDFPEVAAFRDAALSKALGRKVRSYWLSLYAFDKATPEFKLDLARQRIVAKVGGKTLQSLSSGELDKLPAQLRLQLTPLMTPLTLKYGQKTRCLLLFPLHDSDKLEQVILPSGLSLKRATRPARSVTSFLAEPSQAFFESAHTKRK